ncbi:M20/M25/M40 family metallo-hydrolase [Luteolibacter flavescens]|uniref:M20/M25/M40 family metallo-hydrolase n=1 Tax=Luteolibacter flavescens TaxID=1859460 RepID=A0ABT3FRF2_9BACT|nr:M20/M25/M40 family metallo-hydrolase [Luteolibacter flavescens]MCW1886158.1 M20/M25/M40 family metallo-hydrolase [Luteolibacter flavescens]
MTGPVDLLQQLVRIPSVNPDNPAGTDKTGEAALAEFLSGWLAALGAEVALEEIKPGRPNLIARFAPRDGRPRILLGPHLDTVGVGSMTIDPFGGEIGDGRVWGRGTSDTKGPMAAMLWGLKENAARLADLPVAVDFVAFMGEESGQWGSKDFARHHAHDYAFAIVGEPTSLDIVYTTKGSLWATLRATGKAAHSSQPERGDNAAMKLARALDVLERELAAELATYTHDVLGRSTINVGVLRAGSRPNIVPDLAEAEIDIRITPALRDAGGALALLEKTISRLALPLEIVKPKENPPMEMPETHPWIGRIREVRAASRPVGAPWFSDAAHLSDAGLASVCMGPGSIDQAHTCDEFIEIAALEEGAVFFSELVRSLG